MEEQDEKQRPEITISASDVKRYLFTKLGIYATQEYVLKPGFTYVTKGWNYLVECAMTDQKGTQKQELYARQVADGLQRAAAICNEACDSSTLSPQQKSEVVIAALHGMKNGGISAEALAFFGSKKNSQSQIVDDKNLLNIQNTLKKH